MAATESRSVPRSSVGVIGVAIAAFWAVFLSSLALFSGGHLDPLWKEKLFWVALVWSPAVLGILGLRYPRLFIVAGIVSFLMSFVSLAGAGLPFLIPTVLYLTAASSGSAQVPLEPRLPAFATALVVIALLAMAFASVAIHKDPVCWTRKTLAGGRVIYDEYVPKHGPSSSFSRSTDFSGSDLTTLNIESGCSSDRITPVETTASISLVALAIGAGTWMSRPKR